MIDISALTEEERVAVLAARAYKKEWRAKNRDKIREYNARFYKKLAGKQAETQTKEKPSE